MSKIKDEREWEMTDTLFKIIDQTVGVVVVGLAAALFATPFALMLSPVFIVGM